jgi:hypothetical protein
MTDITIPPKALEAAVRTHMNLNLATREEAMRAACLAMLRSWPGMREEGVGVGDGVTTYDWLHLPLNTEPRTSQIDVAELDKTRWD